MSFDYDHCFDVVISGGGISGAVSAISAARQGAEVLVIEQGACLGGTLTSCGVGPMMTFHAAEKQVIAGIMEEIVEKMKTKGYSPGHIRDATNYIYYITPFSHEGLKLVLDELVLEAGCKILFHTFIGGVAKNEDKIEYLNVSNKDGMNCVYGKVFVDATGDGDVATWAGVPFQLGRKIDGVSQPMTMNMKYCNVDTKRITDYIEANSDKFPRLYKDINIMHSTERLAFIGFNEQFEKAKKTGEITIPREDILFFETNTKGEYIINTTRIIEHSAVDAYSLSQAEILGRKQCEELDKFLHKYIPGFENAILEFTGPNVGIRGSRQIKGKYTLTAEDVIECKKFDSVIAHSGYPIDIHNPKGEGTETTVLFKSGSYYSIPYEIMYSDAISNLLVNGRCVSATFEAHAAIRTTPTVGALGHACGIAAAMAAKTDCIVGNVDIRKLQDELIKENAFIER